MINTNLKTYNKNFLTWAELYLKPDLSDEYRQGDYYNRQGDYYNKLFDLALLYKNLYEESPYEYGDYLDLINLLEKLFRAYRLPTDLIPQTFEEINTYIDKIYESARTYSNKPKRACNAFFRACDEFKESFSKDNKYISFVDYLSEILLPHEIFVVDFLYNVLYEERKLEKYQSKDYTYIDNMYELIFRGITSQELLDTTIIIKYTAFSDILGDGRNTLKGYAKGKKLIEENPTRYKPCLFEQKSDGYLKLLFPNVWDAQEWESCIHETPFYMFIWDTYERTFVVDAHLNIYSEFDGETPPTMDIYTLLGYTPLKIEICAEDLLYNANLETLPLREKIRKPKKYLKKPPASALPPR